MDTHVLKCKENTDQFLYDLIFELEELQVKYASKIPEPSYGICIEALNKLTEVITLFKEWKERLNEES